MTNCTLWVFPQFDLNFLDDESLGQLALLYPERLNLVNFLDADIKFEVNIDKCPKAITDDFWTCFPLRDLDSKNWRIKWNIPIPKFKGDNLMRTFLFLLFSPYRLVLSQLLFK